ncbi:MAG TPA: hypothetical protein VFF42_07090 [Candidatus Eremiobacteraceae bacterium]|nr:hypothetical protein [Candidatus Eremiobacteraceae bacterium]
MRGTGDTLRNGGMQNWDISLFKNIPLGAEMRYLQLRVEAFNAFNHPNFNNKHYGASVTGPLTITKNPDWGTPVDTYSFRVIQLGAKFYF